MHLWASTIEKSIRGLRKMRDRYRKRRELSKRSTKDTKLLLHKTKAVGSSWQDSKWQGPESNWSSEASIASSSPSCLWSVMDPPQRQTQGAWHGIRERIWETREEVAVVHDHVQVREESTQRHPDRFAELTGTRKCNVLIGTMRWDISSSFVCWK